MEEKRIAKIRKSNMKLFTVYQMIGLDFIFYYGIEVLFLSQVKGISDANIVLSSSIYAIFNIMMQMPAMVIVNKIGKRNSILLGNILRIVSVILVMCSLNFGMVILARFIKAIAYSLTNICLSPFLNVSIPKTNKKGEIFSHIDGKGYSKYCYIAAISKVLSGYLYTINPYIPMTLCTIALIFATIISYNFIDVEEYTGERAEKITLKENLQNLKEGFSYIFKSERLKALMVMLGVIWGMITLLETYQNTLLKDIKMSATYIGIIYATVQMITGFTSKKANQFNSKFKNRSLTILGLTMTIGCIIIGTTMLLDIPIGIQLAIIISVFCIRHACKGIYQIVKKRYLGNFASNDILPKIYACNGIVTNLMKAFVEYTGSAFLVIMNIKQATLAIGITFTLIIIAISIYMKPRVGIEMKEE